MSARDEPSYLAFARAAARNNESVSGIFARALVERIDRDASALKAAQPRTITTLEDLEALTLPAIIDCKNGGTAKVEYMYGPGRQKYAEFLFGEADESHTLAELAKWALPAQILKEGAQ